MSTSSNMVLIETKTVGAGGSSTIDFTGIPTTGYTDLQIVFSTRSSYDNIYVPWTGFNVTANGSTSGYSGRMLEGNGSSAYSQTNGGSTAWEYAASNDSATTSNTFSSGTIYIPNYAGSTYKSLSMDKVTENNATGASQTIYAGLWSNTAAINRITFTEPNGTFVEGSTASLYGIKSASKVLTPKATGGIISTSGNYVIHTFTASGTFTPNQSLSAEYLIIAGGGGAGGTNTTEGGGGWFGGGGGAGGLLTNVGGSPASLTATAYTVTVGGAGAGGSSGSGPSNGGYGSNSSFNGLTAVGGGGGGSGKNGSQLYGNSGGSGGGGGASDAGSPTGGGGTSGQGYAGGVGTTNGTGYGGSGGGAGGTGNTSAPTGTTPGGAGLSNSITGTSVTYANGGDGGNATVPGSAGQVATGQGGDRGNSATSGSGFSGGSGVVIIRYAA